MAQLRHVPRALKLVWAAASGWTIVSTLLLLGQGLLPVFMVYLTRSLVNALVAVIQSGGDRATLQAAVVFIVLMGLVLVAGDVLGSMHAYVRILLAELTLAHMNGLIHDKAVSLDIEFYESPIYYDQLQRASVDAIDRPLGLLESLNSLMQSTITLLAMGGILLHFAWWMPLVLLVGTLPALWVAFSTTWHFHQWRLQNTAKQRRLNYYHYMLIQDRAASELRLFDLGGYFSLAYNVLRRRLGNERLQFFRKQMTGQILAGLAGIATMALSMLWMAWKALAGRFNLGDLAMFYQAMNQGQRLMRNLLTGVGEIYRNLLFLEDIFSFLDTQPQLVDPETPIKMPAGLDKGIRIEDVTFRYPGSERSALQGFNLEIPAGRIVAIVGENGAGKSTLIKLLCRFYNPEKGHILWDGVDVRDVSQADLRRRVSVLFQEPFSYHETAADNIAFGDLAANPGRDEITAAAIDGGAYDVIRRLPQGFDTVLGKWFGYAELSTGEWQRIALARAFLRKADLVILDEPTSAMDSWAEAAWMARFRELVGGRTALIITHRFTTAMQADVIHVLEQGRVVESGSHTELVGLGGRYAISWRQQMRGMKAD